MPMNTSKQRHRAAINHFWSSRLLAHRRLLPRCGRCGRPQVVRSVRCGRGLMAGSSDCARPRPPRHQVHQHWCRANRRRPRSGCWNVAVPPIAPARRGVQIDHRADVVGQPDPPSPTDLPAASAASALARTRQRPAAMVVERQVAAQGQRAPRRSRRLPPCERRVQALRA